MAQKKNSGSLPSFARKTTQSAAEDPSRGSHSHMHAGYPGHDGSAAGHADHASMGLSPAKPSEQIAPARGVADSRFGGLHQQPQPHALNPQPQQDYYAHLQQAYAHPGVYMQPAPYMSMTPQNAQNADLMEAFKANYHKYQNPGQPPELYAQQPQQHLAMLPPGHQHLYPSQYYDPYALYPQMYYAQQPPANGHQLQMAALPLPHQSAARPGAYYQAGAPGQGHPSDDQRR